MKSFVDMARGKFTPRFLTCSDGRYSLSPRRFFSRRLLKGGKE